jgi:tRNA(fMet)-specific endonuclease VapC
VPALNRGRRTARRFQNGTSWEPETTELWDFLADPAVDVLEVDVEVAERYALIYEDLRKVGTPIPSNDMWIAAASSANGLTVLTFDDHFNLVPAVPSVVLEAG